MNLRTLLRLSLAVGAALLAGACGGRSVARETRADEPSPDSGAPVDVGGVRDCGGLHEFDCPEGLRCFGPPVCGAAWRCQEELPPCSAAAPILACGCDGRVGYIPAGCPERYAWRLDQYQWFTPYTSPCDATLTKPPEHVSASVHFYGFEDFDFVQVFVEEAAVGARAEASGAVSNVEVGVDLVGEIVPSMFDALEMVLTYYVEPGHLGLSCADWHG